MTSRRYKNWYLQQRRRSRRHPAYDLKRTTSEASGATGVLAPDVAAPLTVVAIVSRSGASNGVIFEFGDATRGLALWIDGADVGVAAGLVTPADDGLDGVATDALSDGAQSEFTLGVRDGAIRLWKDGQRILTLESVNGTFDGGWAAAGSNGGFGVVAGAVTTRVPAGQRASLTNAMIVGQISLYAGQLPRAF